MAIIRYRDENGNIVPLRAIKGDKGDQMFVRFSAYPDGTDMVEEWDVTRAYMGYAFGANAPKDKSGYKWINLCIPFFGEHGIDGDYIFRVANGTEEKPSNAMTIDADGNMNVGGEVTFGEDNFSPREAASELDRKIDGVAGGFSDHIASAVRIASGSYIGTGKNGVLDKSSLTFEFAPKLLIIQSQAKYAVGGGGSSSPAVDYAVYVCGGNSMHRTFCQSGEDPSFNVIEASVSNSGKTIEWYFHPNVRGQMNEKNVEYKYTAIG